MNNIPNSSENVVDEKNQQSLQESSTNWDEESLAKLLGYDDSEDNNNTAEETEIETISDSEKTSNNSQVVNDTEVVDSNNNVVDTHELFDHPHDGKTQPTFATNPFAKFGAVGLILLVVFGTGATFLNSIISGKPRTAPLIADSKSEKPKVLFREDTKPAEVENGKLKASLALSTQAEKIKSQEESKNTKTPIPKTDSQAPQKLNKENINTPRKNIASVERTPVVSKTPVYRTIPRPPIRQNYYPAPRHNRTDRALTPAPPKATITSNPPLITSPVRRISPPPKTEKPSEIDPTQQWLAVNQLGSYGTARITPFIKEKNKQKSEEEVEPAVQEKPVLPTTIPSATPLMVSQTYENTTYPKPLYREEARILNVSCFYNESCPIPLQNVRQLKLGSTIAGKLITPLMWDEGSTNQNNPKQSNFNQKENFIVQTTEAFKDRSGFITLPKNTQIVATIKNIQESGLVQLQAKQIIINGKQYILPQQAISIRGNSGKPLVASKRGNKGDDIAARDAETFVVGSLAKIGKVLNQPKTEQFSTSSGFGGTNSFSSTRRGNSNILGAVLEGGFEPLTEQIKERNKRKISEIKQRKKLWYVPANTQVEIFVNQSFILR
ncbi:TrbI/VirB10 family protein [Calothrix sp. CCY 0018]|uniref:TrbI/VirB10 family protein n=1 Tax=Calothrix sp. CCY 0018 TaxID=3103864 RepID=UPI0039C604B0